MYLFDNDLLSIHHKQVFKSLGTQAVCKAWTLTNQNGPWLFWSKVSMFPAAPLVAGLRGLRENLRKAAAY